MKTLDLCKNASSFFGVLVVNLFMVISVRCTPPNETPVSDSYKKKLITYKEGQVLFDEYSRTNNEILTRSRNGDPDSRWYWFSVEDMEGYIKYIKENTDKQGLKNVGIRIYMGKYPANHPVNRMAKPEYAGYQTIFLVPTTQTNDPQKRNEMSDENEDVQSIQPMNMTNLAPPPKTSADGMN